MSHLSRTFSRELRQIALHTHGSDRRDLTHLVMIAEGKEEEIARLLARVDVLEARVPAPAVPKPLPITEHSLHAPPKVSVPVAFGLLDWAESILCNAKPMDHCSQEEWDGIIRSWRDQKHGVKPPPPNPAPHPTDPLQRQYYVPPPTIKWSEEENEILRRAAEAGNPTPKEHNPHGLVAFYTDAP